MTLALSDFDRELLDGRHGDGAAVAMRILTRSAEILGADKLIDVRSAHIDGCLYHGDSGTLFAERLSQAGARVTVPTTLNVGALDLVHAGRVRLDAQTYDMARRMMSAYVEIGCKPTWTCAPYQAGHRPKAGDDVAWGESNAVAFCNSVLGARTNRYGDFLDICCAITGRAPFTGLHVPANRLATVLVDATSLPSSFLSEGAAFPILGTWLGSQVGGAIAAFEGLGRPTDDQLKSLGAAAASSGAVGLFHVIGATPEAATRDEAFGGRSPALTIKLQPDMLHAVRTRMSTVTLVAGDQIDAVAIGSPHLSAAELRELDLALGERHCAAPLYACTGRHALATIAAEGLQQRLQSRGVIVVADTCVVVTPILPEGSGVVVTNSGKFAHYTTPNTGYGVVFASLVECVESAVRGKLWLHRADAA